MVNETSDTFKEFSFNRENVLNRREIQPATLQEIQQQINESYNFAASASEYAYGRNRGADRVLVRGRDYAELPGFNGRSPGEIIESLSPGSSILDVGCGYGQLGAEIVGSTKACPTDEKYLGFSYEVKTPAINAGVTVYGFDAQAQIGQDRLTGIVIGSIDDLSPKTFTEKPEGFDIVVSSSVLYHLPDYWGGILRMARVLKPEGIVLASTMPRVMDSGHDGAEDDKGFLLEPDDGELSYYRDRNVFDCNGRLIPPGEVMEILNKHNQYFRLEYGVATTTMNGGVTNGGQVSGQRLSADGHLDLSCMFYCLSQGKLSYLLAETATEQAKLRQQGYVNLHDRLKTEEELIAAKQAQVD